MNTLIRCLLFLATVPPLTFLAVRFTFHLMEADTTRQHMHAYAPVPSHTPPAAPRSKLKFCRESVAPFRWKRATAFHRKQDGRYFV